MSYPPLDDSGRQYAQQGSANAGYEQQGFAQQPYGQAGYPAPAPKGLSITSMVLGIASLLMGWTFLMPIAGLVFGIMALKREPSARGMSITGIVLSGLCLIGWAIGIAGLIAFSLFVPFAAFSLSDAFATFTPIPTP